MCGRAGEAACSLQAGIALCRVYWPPVLPVSFSFLHFLSMFASDVTPPEGGAEGEEIGAQFSRRRGRSPSTRGSTGAAHGVEDAAARRAREQKRRRSRSCRLPQASTPSHSLPRRRKSHGGIARSSKDTTTWPQGPHPQRRHHRRVLEHASERLCDWDAACLTVAHSSV